ncbi:hypothetical protein OAI74_01130 [Gammaproteobacteria bacterium]|jgi:hypothetical protein|nr:hypothetical protein [Gammaproteobacteria bacterium]MCH1476699.1 hypothetical protein [Arenicellales bacterium]MDC0163984.1 hypothetical protein [Gammaproteobacteria bacterium]MDC1073303.1 hypothetical protein [Gammaproteobacteria bacterium]|tara:strand:- start:55 stop:453 length:399 start_codon:yes stop_codon:yes gene_type:complete
MSSKLSTYSNRRTQVYSKFRAPEFADIANMRPGVSHDRIIEAWLVNRLSVTQSIYRKSTHQLYFCDTTGGATSEAVLKSLLALKIQRGVEKVRVDSLGAIYVGSKIRIGTNELPVVTAALRLMGLEVIYVDF